MTTGRINQVACRAREQQRHECELATPLPADPQRHRPSGNTPDKTHFRPCQPSRGDTEPSESPAGAPLAAARACAVLILWGRAPRTVASLRPSWMRRRDPARARLRQFGEHAPAGRRTERPLRPAGTCWPPAARSYREPGHPARTGGARFDGGPKASPQNATRTRAVCEMTYPPAAAAREAMLCRATRRRRDLAVAAAPSARCTRRFAPSACDESRNHSPNQTCRHAPARALPKQNTAKRGRRIPSPSATRCRVPRDSRCRGRAGARPRQRRPADPQPLGHLRPLALGCCDAHPAWALHLASVYRTTTQGAPQRGDSGENK